MSNKNQFMDIWDLMTDEPGSIFSILLGIDDAPVCVLKKTDKPAPAPCQRHEKIKLDSCRAIPPIERVLFSDPATIVFWEDGTKTIVKCMKGEKYERYAGFAAACVKKLFGSTLHAKDIMEKYGVEQPKKVCKEENKSNAPDCAGKRADCSVVDEMAVGINHEAIREAVDEALNG